MRKRALLIGNSDGIGLATTKRLLKTGWDIIGISRSESPIKDTHYHHLITDVSNSRYPDLVSELVNENPPDLCIYFAGIGQFFNPLDMSSEAKVFEVNLTGMVKTAAGVIPQMVKKGRGHFIGLSSMADELISAEASSYTASKAGFTRYLNGLAIALKPKGVDVTNVRFGFVDTKMAKGNIRPFMISVEKAADYMEYCIRKKPVSCAAPKIVVPLLKLYKLIMKLSGK